MADPFNIYNWYWSVGDQSPGTQVYWTGQTGGGGFVLLSDPTYIAWTGRGNAPTIINLMSNLYKVFDNNCQGAYQAASLTQSISANLNLTNPPPNAMYISATTTGLKVVLPRMDTPAGLPIGRPISITNTGTNTFTVTLSDGSSGSIDILPSRIQNFTLTANTTQNGTVQTTGGAPVTGSFGQIIIRKFTAVGGTSYIPTPGMKYCIVEIVAGGGGAGGVVGAAGIIVGSAGGGSGSYARGVFNATQIGASKLVQIGQGGVGGAGSQNGFTGTASSFGSTLLTTNPGIGGPSSVNAFTGGAGGTAGTGDDSRPGMPGSPATQLSTTAASVNQFCAGGNGAPSFFGGSGLGSYAGSGTTAAGGNGINGGGGGGAHANANASNNTGGSGGNGYGVITEFI